MRGKWHVPLPKNALRKRYVRVELPRYDCKEDTYEEHSYAFISALFRLIREPAIHMSRKYPADIRVAMLDFIQGLVVVHELLNSSAHGIAQQGFT